MLRWSRALLLLTFIHFLCTRHRSDGTLVFLSNLPFYRHCFRHVLFCLLLQLISPIQYAMPQLHFAVFHVSAVTCHKNMPLKFKLYRDIIIFNGPQCRFCRSYDTTLVITLFKLLCHLVLNRQVSYTALQRAFKLVTLLALSESSLR